MRFRPCIDIHNGKVKQIVGGSLRDEGDAAKENFVSEQNASDFAHFYAHDGLTGGHVILLNPASSPYYEETKKQAMAALAADPGHLMVGGGINPDNAAAFLEAGASHVIVTSYVFSDGKINMERLERMVQAVGREHLVLDLSVRMRDDKYYVVTDRWQKFTDVVLDEKLLKELAEYCSEYLIHAADVEGKAAGPDGRIVRLLGTFSPIPVTYAGGVGSFEDLKKIQEEGRGRVDVTVGSALDLFGGYMSYREIVDYCATTVKNQ